MAREFSDEELFRAAGLTPPPTRETKSLTDEELFKIAGVEPPAVTKAVTPEVPPREVSILDKTNAFFLGAADALLDTSEGIIQTVEQFTRSEEANRRQNEQFTKNRAKRERRIQQLTKGAEGFATAGRLTADIALAAAVPTARIPGVLGRIGAQALTGATIAGVQFTPEGGSKLAQAGLGAALGGGLGALGAGVGAVTPTVKGTLVGAAEKVGLPVSLGQITGSPAIQAMERRLATIPIVGTRGFFQKQAKSAAKQADDILASAERAAPGASGLSDDLLETLRRTEKAVRTKSKDLYDDVEKIARESGNIRIRPENTINELNKAVKKAEGAFKTKKLQSEPAKEIIKRAKDKLEGLAEEGDRLNTTQLIDLRRSIQDDVADLFRKKDSPIAIGFLDTVKAIDDDLIKLSETIGPDALRTSVKARNFYRDAVLPFQDGALKKITIGDVDSSRIIDAFVKSNKPKLAANIVKSLNPEGRQALQLGIVKRAHMNALDPSTKTINPIKFLRELDKLGNTAKNVMTPKMKAEITGYQKAIETISSGVKLGEKDLTGLGLVTLTALGAVTLGGTEGVISTAALALALSKGFTTTKGQALFRAFSKAKPGTAAANRTLSKILALYGGEGVAESTSAIQERINELTREEEE